MSQIPIQPVIVARTKSVALSLVLTFFLGPLGMLYSTILGAIVMIVLSVPLFILTLGHAAFLVWPISMIWGAWAAHRYNQRLLRRAGI
jgi:ABC-type phosphate transport system permease subunit